MLRKYIQIYFQKDATLYSLFLANCSTCFGWYFHPSSGGQKTLCTAFGTCKNVTATCRYRGRVGTGLSVVWQKSNETDFLLIMNFILFTNQGYPLQNSSLGRLHNDGGVVSIIRSSVGRLLLVYLSARRLRSSG